MYSQLDDKWPTFRITGEVKERLTKVDWLSVLFQTRPCMKHQILCGVFSLSVSHQNTQSLMHEHFRILNFCYSYFSVSLACTSVRSSLCNCTSLFESDTVCSSDLTQLEIKSILFELAKNAPNSTQKDLCWTVGSNLDMVLSQVTGVTTAPPLP